MAYEYPIKDFVRNLVEEPELPRDYFAGLKEYRAKLEAALTDALEELKEGAIDEVFPTD